MRYCKYCGKEIDDDIAVCPHCGKEIKRIENNTSSEQSTEGKAGIIKRWPAVNSKVFMVIVCGKMILPPHGKEFFHSTVSSFLHPAVSTFLHVR